MRTDLLVLLPHLRSLVEAVQVTPADDRAARDRIATALALAADELESSLAGVQQLFRTLSGRLAAPVTSACYHQLAEAIERALCLAIEERERAPEIPAADRASRWADVREALCAALSASAAPAVAVSETPLPESSAPVQPAALSLDEAAAILITLDPGDEVGVRRVQSAFALATAGDALTSEALAAAADTLQGALGAPELRRREAIDAAGSLLEAAMATRDSAELHVIHPRPADPVPRMNAERETPEHLPEDTDLDLLRDFIAESRDYIEGAEAALLQLENDPGDAEAINTVFRAFHTLKGTSAFLGLNHITTFAHHAESLLSGVRDRGIPFTGAYADLALRSADMLEMLLEIVERASPGGPLVAPAGYDALLKAITAAEESPEAVIELGADAPAPASRDEVAVAPASAGEPEPGDGAPALEELAGRDESRARGARAAAAEASLRVRTDRLDRLIDMVGELVIAQAMIAQDATVTRGAAQDFARKVAHAGKIVRELQDLSMSMRMVPLKATFQKMARLTRDAAHRSGKQVELVLEGEDTEIDRNMVDVIADPLVHMVRNAVDHGIEPPAARAERGKSSTGRLRLAAYHAGGSVVVEVEDDGKGLDRERILRKALAKGLIETDKGMSDADVYNLIFAPGFSTNDVVTDLSGRGVGMDVVKRNIESLQGRIDIASEAGRGSRFTIRLPLTLAITDGMSVRVGAERYIIPTINIQLSFRPQSGALSTVAGRGEMVLLRDDLMPLIRLHRLFGTPGAIQSPTEALLVVVSAGDRQCALLVDELLGQQQVVAKPLGDGVGRIPGIAGGAILGDGRVGLILDVPEIMTLSHLPETGRQAA